MQEQQVATSRQKSGAWMGASAVSRGKAHQATSAAMRRQTPCPPALRLRINGNASRGSPEVRAGHQALSPPSPALFYVFLFFSFFLFRS